MPPKHRKRAAVKQSLTSNDLPESVWTKIGSYLSLKDWAKASGTCRTTFNLKLHSVDVPPALKKQGVAWISRRLSHAHVLRLSTSDLRGIKVALGQGLNRLASLQQVEVTGAAFSSEAVVAQQMSFHWLLANAPKLTLLAASIGKLVWWPPMSQLKHLVLYFSRQEAGSVFEALPLAERLETLSMTSTDIEGVLEAPALQLESLSSLHALQLDGIRPSGTSLPEKCHLHLRDLSKEDFSCVQWEGALAKVHSFHFVDKLLDMHKSIPAFFSKLQNAKSVFLSLKELGSPNMPLPLDALSHVARLCLAGSVAHLKVPARVSWREVMFYSNGGMEVTFEDPTWFAREIQVSCFRYNHLLGAPLFKVIQEWAKCKRPWSAESDASSTVDVLNPPITTIFCPSDACIDFIECCCQSCMPCFKKTGVAHNLQ